jgi:phage-related protein
LECALLGAISPSDLQAKVRALAAHLMDNNGRPQTLELIFDTEPEKRYYVRYAGSLPIQRIVSAGLFTLPLVAYDPFAYSALDAYDVTYEYDPGRIYDSGLIYPNARTVQDWSFVYPAQVVPVGTPREWAGFVWTYSRHMSSQYNHSDYNTPLIVEISGNETNPKITNNNTGQQISIATTLTNQTLLIDGEKMTVTIDGANAINLMSGDFIDLQPGDNGFFFEGINPYATVTYKWEHKFL